MYIYFTLLIMGIVCLWDDEKSFNFIHFIYFTLLIIGIVCLYVSIEGISSSSLDSHIGSGLAIVGFVLIGISLACILEEII